MPFQTSSGSSSQTQSCDRAVCSTLQMSVASSISKAPQVPIGVQSCHLKLGIIGTANVGKSSLFNLLYRNEQRMSPSENCLFRTTEPYIGIFTPPDPSIEYIAEKLQIAAYPVSLTVADTAGLVEGSYRENKGVGASTLQVLTSVDLILHVLRQFEDENITHYHATIDPLRDMEIVNNEILQFDLDVIESTITDLETIRHREQGGDYLAYQLIVLKKAWMHLAGSPRPERPSVPKKTQILRKLRPPLKITGSPLRYYSWDPNERMVLADLKVLSTKKVLYLVNMAPRDYLRSNSAQHPAVLAIQQSVELTSGEIGKDAEVFPISLAFEESLRRIELQEGPEALKTYYQANPTHVSAVGTILTEVHRALGIIHFYTADERMVRCWCVKQGKNIQESAAVVDVNLSRHFLRGEVIPFADYQRYGGDRLKLMMDAKLKSETKKYIVNEGDIIEFFVKKK